MPKRRQTFKLDNDEVAIVGTIDRWRHLIMVYESLASQAENSADADAWMQHGAWIREWLNQTDSQAWEE
jgi:hypothetical protein